MADIQFITWTTEVRNFVRRMTKRAESQFAGTAFELKNYDGVFQTTI